MGRSMTGQRSRPSSTTMLTVVTTTATSTEILNGPLKPENSDIWLQYLEQYLLPVGGTAVAIFAVQANDSLVNWLVGIFTF